MPYIAKDERQDFEIGPEGASSGLYFGAATAGELNYCVTVLVDEFLNRNGLSYTSINTVIGVLECAKLELYRRIAAPYEDKKIKENGDVYSV